MKVWIMYQKTSSYHDWDVMVVSPVGLCTFSVNIEERETRHNEPYLIQKVLICGQGLRATATYEHLGYEYNGKMI